MAEVVLEQVSRVYSGGVHAVSSLDLVVADGELLVLVGPSGCGKTTTLRLIAGLETATCGTIRIGGRDMIGVRPRERDVAMVFQSQALHPHLTVYGNMAFGPRLRSDGSWLKRLWWRMAQPMAAKQKARERAEIPARICQCADMLGIVGLLDRYPNELSGGERQRAAVAKAMLRRPAAFLLDEPLSNLDAKLRVELRRELKALHTRVGGTMVYVTHDQGEAMTIADRVAVLDRGRLQQLAPPAEIYARPANRFVAGFMGAPAMNLIEGVLHMAKGVDTGGTLEFHSDAWTVPIGRPTPHELLAYRDRRVVLGLRPTDMHLRPSVGADECVMVEAFATMIEPLGDETVVHLTRCPSAEKTKAACGALDGQNQTPVLVCKTGPGARVRLGERARVWLCIERAHWFDADSGRSICSPSVAPTPDCPAT
jgi:multiple sugar transport system ATP-binding protein